MSTKYIASLCFILFSFMYVNAQNESLLDEIAMQSVVTEFGRPLNNGVDPSQIRFGEWFYMSALHQPFYKRQYTNGTMVGESILLENKYIAVDLTLSTSELKAKASEILSAHNLESNYQKGCVFVVNPSDMSFMEVIPYGNWSAYELEKINGLVSHSNPNTVVNYVAIIWK